MLAISIEAGGPALKLAEEGLIKNFLFLGISYAGDIGWDPNFEMGDGGIRIIRGY